MAIHRVTSVWSGFTGAPGYTNFYFVGDAETGGIAANFAVRQFWQELEARIPSGVTVTTEAEHANIDESTGTVTSYYTPEHEGSMATNGSSSGGYSSATGAVVGWNTDTVRAGRRVRGRTFIVPLGGGAYDTGGSLTSIVQGIIQTAANNLLSNTGSNNMVVWARPINGAGGVAAPIVSARVPDLAAVLRSRRD